MKNPIKILFSKEETDVKVANNRLFSYAAGLAGQNAAYNFVSNRVFVYINTVLGIKPENTGLITGLQTLWDAVNDPIVGTYIDSRKFKPGNKLRPLILYTSPIIGFLIAMMFCTFGFSPQAAVIYMVVLYLLYDLLYSFQDVALWGMLSLSSPNSEERSRVSQWVTIGASVGSIIGGAFPMVKNLLVENKIMSERMTYFVCGILFGFGGMLVSCFAYRMREKVNYVPEKKNSVIDSLKTLKYNKTLLIICLARFVCSLSPTLPWEYFFETQGISYNFFGTTINGGTMQVIYGLIPGIPGAFTIFFATKFAKKIGGMKKVLICAEVTQIICRLAAFALGNNNRYLSIGILAAIWVFDAIRNIPVGMKDIAHRSLISDSIDEVELVTGERTEGIAFSMQNFISKLTSSAAKIIQGYLLKFMGFATFKDKLTGKPLEGSALIAAQSTSSRFYKYRWHQFALGPVVGSVLYLIVILFLKDDREHMAEVERQLSERRRLAETESVTVG